MSLSLNRVFPIFLCRPEKTAQISDRYLKEGEQHLLLKDPHLGTSTVQRQTRWKTRKPLMSSIWLQLESVSLVWGQIALKNHFVKMKVFYLIGRFVHLFSQVCHHQTNFQSSVAQLNFFWGGPFFSCCRKNQTWDGLVESKTLTSVLCLPSSRWRPKQELEATSLRCIKIQPREKNLFARHWSIWLEFPFPWVQWHQPTLKRQVPKEGLVGFRFALPPIRKIKAWTARKQIQMLPLCYAVSARSWVHTCCTSLQLSFTQGSLATPVWVRGKSYSLFFQACYHRINFQMADSHIDNIWGSIFLAVVGRIKPGMAWWNPRR